MYRLLLLAVSIAISVNGDTMHRLNSTIKPSAYSIYILPYFNTGDETAFTFYGNVTITFTTESATSQIKLHSEDLNIDAGSITVKTENVQVPLNDSNPISFDTNYTFLYINLASDLNVNSVYTLDISYTGPIREDLKGFYRNYYVENGVKKWLGATQMEPTHARKVFPCFDEPHLKATFTLTIDRPDTYTVSLANTKIQSSVELDNGMIREVFHPTPIMSTYLVAFLVSEFEAARYEIFNDTREFGIYTRPEAVNQSEYAFDFGVRVVNALSEYYKIDYYSVNEHLKLDHVALVNFASGAMENWGLVTYRESLLLYDPEESSPYYKYRVAQIMAHETTHMWFGNLVTCHWWSDTWLNEGFANYFQDYITALIEPEVASSNILVTGSVYSAYDADESASSPPISNWDVNSPAEISGHFGTITYQKAGSVIRMMHHLMGDTAFRDGLNSYLETNQFKSGYPELMYEALQKGVNNTNAFESYPGIVVADVMEPWIIQAGHPVLDVEIDYETNMANLGQRRFYSNGSLFSNETYWIPITYTTGAAPDFNDTKPVLIMTEKTHSLNVSEIGKNHTWVIFNIQETGLYRVKYDVHTYEIIAAALKGNQRESINNLNRAKIVNDLFAFFFADEIEFSILYDLIDFLRRETDYSVWYAAITGLNKLREMYKGTDLSADIDKLSLSLLENIIEELGYEEKADDDFETLRNRMQVLEFACKLDHPGCIEKTVQLFRNFTNNGVPIAPSLRTVSYCSGLRQGSENDYEFLWKRMSETNLANEARLIGSILGCSTNLTSLKKFLFSMQEEDSPIMYQDLTVPLTGVLRNSSHVNIVLDSLKQNTSLWISVYKANGMDTVYQAVAAALQTETEMNEFEQWLQSCEECEGDKSQAYSRLNQNRANKAWAQSRSSELLSSMRNDARAVTSSTILVIALIMKCMCEYSLAV